jgi:hypothetical protein
VDTEASDAMAGDADGETSSEAAQLQRERAVHQRLQTDLVAAYERISSVIQVAHEVVTWCNRAVTWRGRGRSARVRGGGQLSEVVASG